MRKQWQRTVAQTPLIGPVALFLFRTRLALRYYRRPSSDLVRWLFKSNETTNFTYRLEQDNRNYMASTIAHVLNADYSTIARYMDEVEADEELKRHIIETTALSRRSTMADGDMRLGRRLGWYAFVRMLKPEIVVETGVDKGLGACVLTAALMRNAEEGYGGRYFGTDINPEAGYLLTGHYGEFGEVVYGDSIQTLSSFGRKIDLFINDSDHSVDYEAAEYDTVADKLSERAVILGDNCEITNKLFEFSLKHGRDFIYFAEVPSGHYRWYRGGGIGISFVRSQIPS